MSGACNKANGRQNSKRKAAWAAKATQGTFDAHKERRIAADKRRKEVRARKLAKRVAAKKPLRGHARRMARFKSREVTHEAAVQ